MLETLLIGAAGGALFYAARLPGGLITGAMIAVATAGLAGRRMGLPQPLAHIILMTLGLSLGAMVSPEMIRNLAAYPITIGLLAVATFCATFSSSLYLRRVHGWDRTSALLAGSPGALSQIILLAAERNADVPGITVVQTVRVIILTAAVPLLLAASGMGGQGTLPAPASVASPPVLLALVAAAAAVALLLRLVNFPASWMFGAMLGSLVLHGAGLVEGTLPQWAYFTALVGIGTLIGSRFGAIRLRTIGGHLVAALGSFAVAITISALFVAAIALTTQVRFGDIVVACVWSLLGIALDTQMYKFFPG